MKATGELLLTIFKNYLTGEPLAESANYGSAFQLAKMHSLGNLFYEAVKNSPIVPIEVKEAAKQHFFSNLARQTAQEYYAAELFEKLEEKKIWYMPLKGYVFRRLYPSPELRTSCDLDVLYDKTKKAEVGEILKGFGFKEGHEGENHIDWSLDTVTVEMHHELAAQSDVYHPYYQNVFERLVNTDGCRYDFTPEDFYVYFLVHAAKHFAHGGFGIRTVLDVWIYRKNKALDEEYLNKELEKVQLLKFKTAVEALAEYWFGEREKTEELELLHEYVLTSGTYGRRSNSAAIGGGGNGVKKRKFKFLMRTIFPSLRTMRAMYPVLKKAPILLPFTWVARWFAVLFTRRKNVGAVLNAMNGIDDEKIEKVDKVIEITDIPLR